MLGIISKKEFNILKSELQSVKKENEKFKNDMRDLQRTFEKTIEERFDYLFNKMYEIQEEVKEKTESTCIDMISKEFYKERFKLIEFEAKLMKRVFKIDTKE